MSSQIQTELFTVQLFDLLDETFAQVHGIYLDRGTSLFETLEQISSAEASLPVGGKCASLAAQVKHITFYLDVLERYLVTRENVDLDWGEVWRTTREVTPEQWDEYQDALKQAYQRVLATLRECKNWDDGDQISGAMAIVVHTAYHLGEIRQAMCTLKK